MGVGRHEAWGEGCEPCGDGHDRPPADDADDAGGG